MTKLVRIENADTSTYKVRVRVYDRGIGGAPDTLALEDVLTHPAAMTDSRFYLTSTRYMVVDEVN